MTYDLIFSTLIETIINLAPFHLKVFVRIIFFVQTYAKKTKNIVRLAGYNIMMEYLWFSVWLLLIQKAAAGGLINKKTTQHIAP